MGCYCWTFEGCFGAVFAPALASEEASGLGDYYSESDFGYLYCFHSLVVGTVVVLLVAVAIVDTTRDVDGTVTSTRDAFVNIGTFLEDVVDLVT